MLTEAQGPFRVSLRRCPVRRQSKWILALPVVTMPLDGDEILPKGDGDAVDVVGGD